jgi:hypothetical protein
MSKTSSDKRIGSQPSPRRDESAVPAPVPADKGRQDRLEREAAALRRNLLLRKQQQRARIAGEEVPAPGLKRAEEA